MDRTKKKTWIKFRNQVRKAIRLHCHECMGGRVKTDCGAENCEFYDFRPKNKKCQWPMA